MIEIPLRNRDGSVAGTAIVSDEDAELAARTWTLNGNGYVWRHVVGRPTHEYLHRVIAGATSDGRYVDHINRDRLDCRRDNLRIVTPAESAQNKPALTGRFRGVTWDRSRGKWTAQVQLNGQHHFLGRFDDELAAARVASAWRSAHMPFAVESER